MPNKIIELLISAKDVTKNAFNSTINRLKGVEKQAKKVQKLGSIVGGLFAGYGAIQSFRAVISATREQEAALKQVEARLKSTEGVSGETIESLQKMAEGFQQITTYGDEAILKMQSLLLTFTNIRGDTFEAATESILDMSIAMGQDLKTSALQLGKALNDPIKGINSLTRIGVKFTDQQKEQIKALTESGEIAKAQAIILKELQTEFGGAAKAAADTFGGALNQLSNAFGDLLESDSGGLVNAKTSIQELTAILQDPATKAAFDSITSAIISMTSGVAKGVTELVEFARAMGEIIGGASGFGAEYDLLQQKIDETTEKIRENADEIDSIFTRQSKKNTLKELNRLLEKELQELKQQQQNVFDDAAQEKYNKSVKDTKNDLSDVNKELEKTKQITDQGIEVKADHLIGGIDVEEVKKIGKDLGKELARSVQDSLNENPVKPKIIPASSQEIREVGASSVLNIAGYGAAFETNKAGLSGFRNTRLKEGRKT